MRQKILTWGIVPNRVSLTLEIMVLTGSTILPALITPYNAPIPVILI
jgi:hypothetical protein